MVANAADSFAFVHLVEGAEVIGWVGQVGAGDLTLFGARRECLRAARAEMEILGVRALVATARVAATGERDLVGGGEGERPRGGADRIAPLRGGRGGIGLGALVGGEVRRALGEADGVGAGGGVVPQREGCLHHRG